MTSSGLLKAALIFFLISAGVWYLSYLEPFTKTTNTIIFITAIVTTLLSFLFIYLIAYCCPSCKRFGTGEQISRVVNRRYNTCETKEVNGKNKRINVYIEEGIITKKCRICDNEWEVPFQDKIDNARGV